MILRLFASVIALALVACGGKPVVERTPEMVFGATGASIDHIIKRGFVQTADATPATLVSITVPLAIEGVVSMRGWAEGVKSDAAKAFRLEIVGIGTVNGGSFGLTDQASFGSEDVGTSTYSAQLSEVSSNVIGILVTGAAASTVIWQGRLEIELVEQTMTGGG